MLPKIIWLVFVVCAVTFRYSMPTTHPYTSNFIILENNTSTDTVTNTIFFINNGQLPISNIWFSIHIDNGASVISASVNKNYQKVTFLFWKELIQIYQNREYYILVISDTLFFNDTVTVQLLLEKNELTNQINSIHHYYWQNSTGSYFSIDEEEPNPVFLH